MKLVDHNKLKVEVNDCLVSMLHSIDFNIGWLRLCSTAPPPHPAPPF